MVSLNIHTIRCLAYSFLVMSPCSLIFRFPLGCSMPSPHSHFRLEKFIRHRQKQRRSNIDLAHFNNVLMVCIDGSSFCRKCSKIGTLPFIWSFLSSLEIPHSTHFLQYQNWSIMFSVLNQLRSFTRTSKSAQNPMILDGGRALLEFTRTKSSPNFMRATVPQRLESEMQMKGSLSFPQQRSSNLIPPLHWHALQDETFSVVSGHMVATVSGKQNVHVEGESTLIPRGQYHTFANASDSVPLVIDVQLTPDNRLRDERFFRNAYGYLDDVTKAGKQPSPFQGLLFLWSADIIPALSGPQWLMAPLGKFLGWFGGVVMGKWVLGYREW